MFRVTMQNFLVTTFRCFLIWSNGIQILLLLSKLTWIRWTVHSYSTMPDKPRSAVATISLDNNTQVIEYSWTSSLDSTNGTTDGQFAQQIQFPILFMAAMMCIVLYLVGIIGDYSQRSFDRICVPLPH
jgi:hypothetical protein